MALVAADTDGFLMLSILLTGFIYGALAGVISTLLMGLAAGDQEYLPPPGLLCVIGCLKPRSEHMDSLIPLPHMSPASPQVDSD